MLEKSTSSKRLALVDALRGIAAFAVVLYHIPGPIREAAHVPAWLGAVLDNGFLGVNVFFVLSGFVISLSVANAERSFRYLGQFILRRSIRLDPPYWLAMIVEVALGVLGMRMFGAKDYPIPSLLDIAAHVTYTQDLFRRAQISDVFWTLCFEIQFYVALVTALVLANNHRLRALVKPQTVLAVAFVVVTVASALIRNGWLPNPIHGLALIRAQEFLMGCLCYLVVTERVSKPIGLTGLTVVLLLRILGGGVVDAMVTAATFAVCFISYTSPAIDAFARAGALQFLGRISYSLYLFHASVVGRASTLAVARLAPTSSLTMGIALVMVIAASVLFSYLCYLAVERPALQFSRRIRFGSHRQATPAIAGTQ